MAKKPKPVERPQFNFDLHHPGALAVFCAALPAAIASRQCQVRMDRCAPEAIEYAVSFAAGVVDEVNRRMGVKV